MQYNKQPILQKGSSMKKEKDIPLSIALSILCQGFVVAQDHSLDKPAIFTREWWKKPFGDVNLYTGIGEELEQELLAELGLLVKWIQGNEEVSQTTFEGWVRKSNAWLTSVL